MSHSTTAAVRQYEMNVNITLLTTTTCAARPNFRPDHEPLESNDVGIVSYGTYVPRRKPMAFCPAKQRLDAIRTCVPGPLNSSAITLQRTEVPFQSGPDYAPNLPARLADGLGLESAPIHVCESAPQNPGSAEIRSRDTSRLVGFPALALQRARLGCTPASLPQSAQRRC